MRGPCTKEAASRLWIPLLVATQLALAPTVNALDSPWDPYNDGTATAPAVSTPAMGDIPAFFSSLRAGLTAGLAPSSTPSSSHLSTTSSSSSITATRHSSSHSSFSSSTLSTPSASSSSSTTTAAPRSAALAPGDLAATSTSPVPSPTSQSDLVPSHGWSTRHRNLVIILSVVLGVFGIILILSTVCCAWRYRHARAPFGRRGVSPINDEEIATWRGLSDRKEMLLDPESGEILPKKAPARLLFDDPYARPRTGSPARGSVFGTFPSVTTRPLVAKAPNARAGLTDETVPGADPFIPPVRRKSSRLSKAPPGHGRSRSSKSSISTKSIWNYQNEKHYTTRERMTSWYNPHDDTPAQDQLYSKRFCPSPADSIHDLAPTPDPASTPMGGLSPRPASHFKHTTQYSLESDWDIGRAIS